MERIPHSFFCTSNDMLIYIRVIGLVSIIIQKSLETGFEKILLFMSFGMSIFDYFGRIAKRTNISITNSATRRMEPSHLRYIFWLKKRGMDKSPSSFWKNNLNLILFSDVYILILRYHKKWNITAPDNWRMRIGDFTRAHRQDDRCVRAESPAYFLYFSYFTVLSISRKSTPGRKLILLLRIRPAVLFLRSLHPHWIWKPENYQSPQVLQSCHLQDDGLRFW